MYKCMYRKTRVFKLIIIAWNGFSYCASRERSKECRNRLTFITYDFVNFIDCFIIFITVEIYGCVSEVRGLLRIRNSFVRVQKKYLLEHVNQLKRDSYVKQIHMSNWIYGTRRTSPTDCQRTTLKRRWRSRKGECMCRACVY